MRVEQEIAKYEKLEALKSIMRNNLQFSQSDVEALSYKPQAKILDVMTFKYGTEINNKAATMIQAGFRAWKVRKRTLPRLKERMKARALIATVLGRRFRIRSKERKEAHRLNTAALLVQRVVRGYM